MQDSIQAKLDKIKKDFDRSQRDIVSHSHLGPTPLNGGMETFQAGSGPTAGFLDGEATALGAVRDQFSHSLLSPATQHPQFVGGLELT